MDKIQIDQLSPELVFAAGAIGFIIIGIFCLISVFLCAGSLRLATGLLGNNKPNYVACLGWVLAIGFVNAFIASLFVVLFGRVAILLVSPLLFCIALYFISLAADCGWIQAFAIHILNSVISTIGVVVLLIAMLIPIGMMGALVPKDVVDSTGTSTAANVPGSNASGAPLPNAVPVKFSGASAPSPSSARPPATMNLPVKKSANGTSSNPFFAQ